MGTLPGAVFFFLRTLFVTDGAFGFTWHKRPCPSAGCCEISSSRSPGLPGRARHAECLRIQQVDSLTRPGAGTRAPSLC